MSTVQVTKFTNNKPEFFVPVKPNGQFPKDDNGCIPVFRTRDSCRTAQAKFGWRRHIGIGKVKWARFRADHPRYIVEPSLSTLFIPKLHRGEPREVQGWETLRPLVAVAVAFTLVWVLWLANKWGYLDAMHRTNHKPEDIPSED